jgi:hypothetical protein
MLHTATWTILTDKRCDCYTFFASLNEEELAADTGPGRWHNPADGTGYFVCEAKSVTAVHE